MRIGFGMDVHRLEAGLPLIIGSVTIPNDKGCLAHSDGDVLIHAVCDALLGAAAMSDIGYHFPDNDQKYKGIRSTILLEKVKDMISAAGFRIVNIDTTIVLQKPKISPFIEEMIMRLTDILGIESKSLSVKATTSEKLGYEGREEGVTAYAVCILENV